MLPLWREAFASSDQTVSRSFFSLHKGGELLLALPDDRRGVLSALELYPAQRRVAKLWRFLLRWWLILGLPYSRIDLAISPGSPFAQFLKSVAQTSSLPHFAVLSGNSTAQGRRFLFLVFNDAWQPVATIKVGLAPESRRLIEKEETALSMRLATMPALLSSYDGPECRAIALAYLPGRQGDAAASPGPILSEWIDSHRLVPLAELCPALRLSGSCHPVIWHGDFAPWNIRIQPDGQWRVLDWERGAHQGPPCWDWFHYLLQPLILVRGGDTELLYRHVSQLLSSPEFHDYTHTAKVGEFVRPLLIAYLENQLTSGWQSQRSAQVGQLLAKLRSSWPHA